MDTPFPPAPSIQREDSTYGYSLQPTEVARIANSIKDGVAPTRNIGRMLASSTRREEEVKKALANPLKVYWSQQSYGFTIFT